MRDELIKNRAKGIRMAQLNGERVEFKTDAEMASALGDLE
ncbi:phage head-tail joining protein, partial [Paracoccus sp. SM22M-07]